MNLDRIIAVRNRKTVYRDGELCMKVFDESYSKADILAEALNQARIEQTGLHIPKIREVTVFDGKWTIVTDYIKGKSLDRLLAEQPSVRKDWLERFVALQLQVQANTCPLLPRLHDAMRRKIDAARVTDALRGSLHARLDELREDTRLCHGDFAPTNVIVATDGTPYLLDWSHATQGAPAADAARTYLRFWLDGAIDGAERYLEIYCRESRTEVRTVRRWLPIVAAAQSVKGNEKEREFLYSWIRDVNREDI